MRTAGLAKLTLVVGLVSVLVGCTPLFKSSQNVTPPLKPDSASQANFQPLSALGDSCSSPILEPDRSSLLQEALADSQLQAVKAQLESRGFSINAEEAQAIQLAGGQQLLIPFGENVHLVWTRTNGQTAAVGLIRQGNKTLNVSATGTVKNEGTVAVTLTLSTSAPYKLVSVLPTLSPGQSGQVTVRFDPSESGSFTGTVQVGITDGQGSVSSSPLVGVAHKIEIKPAKLDFGVVIVDPGSGVYNYIDQKFTVKNQGITTVTLEAPVRALNAASPFQAILETSPIVLEPSSSIGLRARFSPSQPGIYTGSIDLRFDSVIKGIPAWGLAYTPAEASRHSNMTMIDQYNWALTQEGVEGGVLYAEDLAERTKLLLAGFENITLEQIQLLLRTATLMSQGIQGNQSDFCSFISFFIIEQPNPSVWISLAREFLNSNPNWRDTINYWDAAARKIGTLTTLVGDYSQNKFNLYVAALVLAVKAGFDNPNLWGMSPEQVEQAQQRADQILRYNLAYVLKKIKDASDGTTAEHWIDIIRVAANTLLGAERGDGSHWILLDFLRVIEIDRKGQPQEKVWTSSDSPPPGHTIEVVAWRPFIADPNGNGTLLAFLKVDPSSQLDTQTTSRQMLSWIRGVYRHISNNVVSGAAYYWHGMKVAGWIFTQPQTGAYMNSLIGDLIRILTQNFPSGLPHPFFVAYTADGQQQVVCFDCKNKNEITAVWLAACQLGGICPRDVRIVNTTTGRTMSATDDYSMIFLDPGEGGASMPTGELFFLGADGGGAGGDPPPSECGQ